MKASFERHQVTVGDYQMHFKDFLQYLDLNTDDMPLYLFDKEFAVKAPQLANDFQVCLGSKNLFYGSKVLDISMQGAMDNQSIMGLELCIQPS